MKPIRLTSAALVGSLITIFVSLPIGIAMGAEPDDKHLAAAGAIADGRLNVDSLVAQQNQFTVDLYRQLASEPGQNVFCSPLNVYAALALVEPGAAGSTAAELRRLLFPQAPIAQEQLQGLQRALCGSNQPQGYELRLGAAGWFQQQLSIKEPFRQALAARGLSEPYREVDFVQAGEAAREEINRWASDQTGGMIPKILAEDDIDPLTRFVLCSAIYFQGKWSTPFSPDSTRPAPFRLADGKAVLTPMMFQTGRALFAQHEDFAIGALTYGDKKPRMQMLLIVPNDPDGLSAIEAELSAERLDRWVASMRRAGEVRIGLPKFQMRNRFQLKAPLTALGAGEMFRDTADFSNITDEIDLWISKVIHEAAIEVDEEGTEAAAATAVIGITRSLAPEKPKRLVADRPFLFAIHDQLTGAYLFVGRMANPKL